jgi:hypothetical protein
VAQRRRQVTLRAAVFGSSIASGATQTTPSTAVRPRRRTRCSGREQTETWGSNQSGSRGDARMCPLVRGRGSRIVREAAENRVGHVDFASQHFRFPVSAERRSLETSPSSGRSRHSNAPLLVAPRANPIGLGKTQQRAHPRQKIHGGMLSE